MNENLNERNHFHQIGQVKARNFESVPRSINYGNSESERGMVGYSIPWDIDPLELRRLLKESGLRRPWI